MASAPDTTTIHLDLDDYQRPPEEVIPTFTVKLGGRPVSFTGPEDMEWQDLLEIDEPNGFLRHALTPEDRKHVYSLNLKGFQFAKLMEAYQEHYQVKERMAEARRRNGTF